MAGFETPEPSFWAHKVQRRGRPRAFRPEWWEMSKTFILFVLSSVVVISTVVLVVVVTVVVVVVLVVAEVVTVVVEVVRVVVV